MFMHPSENKRIAIVGGGPSGLFVCKQMLEANPAGWQIDIFESRNELGTGFPYSREGSRKEHITNVSGNEIPELVTSVMDWLATVPDDTLAAFELSRDRLSEYKVLPRLLFGQYLNAQFGLLQEKAQAIGITLKVHFNTRVTDVQDGPADGMVVVQTKDAEFSFHHAVICTGHVWPKKNEGKVPGYYDSPYPPVKLAKQFNHAIAIKGSSLTAIDAIRTLARQHGSFEEKNGRTVAYTRNKNAQNFKIAMYSLHGLLPGIRFHLEDTHLAENSMLTKEEIADHIKANGGFLSLDYIFEKDFKEAFKEKQPEFYQLVKHMGMEEFVGAMMARREQIDPFTLFKMEYAEAEKSIRRKESVYWKEMLAALSFAMNYPAKYFSAEDMQRLKKVLMPLISIVIAFVPQNSCEEMMVLHEAGLLEMVWVDKDSHEEPREQGGVIYFHTDEAGKKIANSFETYIDCTGQKHLMLEDFPFKSMVEQGTISAARIPFRQQQCGAAMETEGDKNVVQLDGKYYLNVPGIAITDSFRVVGKDGNHNPRIFIMAVPYIGGFNPDYSGLDFCEEASNAIVNDILTGHTAAA